MANYDLYPVELRREDHTYGIQSSKVHSHEFSIDVAGPTTIDMAHVMPEAQDGSLTVWLSTKPMGQMMFASDNLDTWSMSRTPRQLVFYNLAIVQPGDGKIGLATGIPYYINVQNVQNSGNTYYLEFSF